MDKSTAKFWKFVLEVLVAAISAAITALGTTSCMSTAGII